MGVHHNLAAQGRACSINDPGGLPFSSPESSKLGVNASDLNLEKAFGVEEDSASSFSRSKLPGDIFIHAFLDVSPIVSPSFIELGSVLVNLVFAHDSGAGIKGIEHELEIPLAVIVAGIVSLIFLSLTEVNHGLVSFRKVDLAMVLLKVLSNSVSDIRVVNTFFSSDLLDVS